MAGSPDVLTGTFAGRYTIERELGSGATATVYLARDTQRGINVAVKLLRPELAQSVGADRFLREIRLNEKLHHPHIVPVLDSGEHDGRLYFVLPHMEEGSLRQLLQREKQLPVETAITITRTIAQALDYAHQQNLIHRDVKPENILFTSGQACLADFGIARAVERAMDESTTDTGMVRGTPAYMSPEQASGSRQYDGRSDQYSLACVLYEMLAGVPAFIGPTPEAVIAQRFQHAPRELRIYRPAVSMALDSVLMKALALAPADRYATAREFADALDASRTSERRPSGPSVGVTRPKMLALFGTVAIVAAAGLGLATITKVWSDPAIRTDSTRVAVFPFATRADAAAGSPQELIHTALRRWQPLDVVALSQISEALRSKRIASAPSLSQANVLAAGLGAGRFVLGQIVPTPTGHAVLAEYRDVSGKSLYSVQMELPRDSSRVRGAYESLVDSLVLRGRNDGAPRSRSGIRHLYATQALIEGVAARDQWALERADSLLARATELDPDLARAQLWLAQVRVWRGLPLAATAIERAATARAELSGTEQLLSDALSAMNEGRFPDACAIYQRMVDADARNFVGWFGLGECQRRDIVVVKDARSMSGWRFRSDYAAELRAYTRAFELLPSTHRAFQANGYNRLRGLLFTSARTVRRGVGPGNRDFLASLQLVHDSLRLVPFDVSASVAADSRANADPRAIARSRSTFHAIVSRWSSAFPNSAAAKEAVAMSLELQGDPTALDTLAVAERLATDSEQRLRFAAARVVLLVKFGAPDNERFIRASFKTADSLLRSLPEASAGQAAVLAPIATLVGDCVRTTTLQRAAASSVTVNGVRVAADVAGEAQALLARTLLGCRRDSTLTPASIAARISVEGGSGPDVRSVLQYRLLGAAVAATFPLDSAWVTQLAPAGDYLLRAEADVLSGHVAAARSTLERVRANRRTNAGDVSIDAVVPEIQLLLRIGDTATARAELESALRGLRNSEPLAPFNAGNGGARIGAMLWVMSTYSTLALDERERRRWRAVPLTLWQRASSDDLLTLQVLKKNAGT